MLIYSLIFAVILICFFIDEIHPRYNKLILWLVAVILILFAGLRAPGVDNDSWQYYSIFEHVRTFSDVYGGRTDLMALALPYLLKVIGIYSLAACLTIFAALGVGFKIRACSKFSIAPLHQLPVI